jgi:preflagellin peptidase FlaK
MQELDIIRLIVGSVILFYASYTDIKTRTASNYLWIIMGGIGAILIAIEYFTGGLDNTWMYLIFIPIMFALVYVLFQLRLIFGGADAKALWAIAILVPITPIINNFPIFYDSAKPFVMPFSWSIFSNSIIIFLFIPLSLFIYNISNKNLSFPHCFLGYKMKVKKAREKFVWPLEKIVDGKQKFVYMPKDFDADEELKEFERAGIKEIWVTPKIPFMIPLLIGFIISFILGDILFFLMNNLFS